MKRSQRQSLMAQIAAQTRVFYGEGEENRYAHARALIAAAERFLPPFETDEVDVDHHGRPIVQQEQSRRRHGNAGSAAKAPERK